MSVSASSAASYSSKPSSGVLDTFQEENKYKPVTNFDPQERVNPFDKGTLKTSATNQTVGSATSTTSSSSISSSSISSRINRNGNIGGIKSPPPPTGPPPPPPAYVGGSGAHHRHSISTTPTSAGKDKRSSFNYGSSTSIETITRMDTTTTSAGPSSEAAAIGTMGPDLTNNAIGGAMGAAAAVSSASGGPDWKSNMGIRSASVYSAPAAVSSAVPAAGDTSGYASNSSPASNVYNTPADLPSYTRPSYSRSESNASNKQSDLDIIFGETKPSVGNGKFTRSGGSLSDAELIFGGPPTNYKADRFGASKSMSVTSERSNDGANGSNNSYRAYEGIQNAAFSDFSDSPKTGSMSSITSFGNTNMTANTNLWSKPTAEEDDELDLK